jgi:subtilase family serine protease
VDRDAGCSGGRRDVAREQVEIIMLRVVAGLDTRRAWRASTAYPQFNCGNTTGCWTFFGGTSAATPQTAALVALVNAARAPQGKQPIGFLDPLLYGGVGASAYTDIVPQHYGTAPKTFAGAEVGVSGPVLKSVGDLQDNQLWQVPIAGYPTTTGYDATTGWGTPNASAFVGALAAMP